MLNSRMPQKLGQAWSVQNRSLLSACIVALLALYIPCAADRAPAIRVDYVDPATIQSAGTAPGVIFSDSFDHRAPDGRYLEYDDAHQSFVWASGEGLGGGGAMRCTFQKGQVSAGNLKLIFGRNPFHRGPNQQTTYRDIYWRIYAKHQSGWNGNPAKFVRATCLAGTDWSQGFIAHVWGGNGEGLCIDPATGIRENRKVTERYNDFDRLHWLGYRQGVTPIFSTAESGRWVCVECRVRLNTPGKSDGEFTLWVDGTQEASRTDLDWQGTWTDYAIDAVFIDNYWNAGSPVKQSRWFDNFVVADRPIGPIEASVRPTVVRTDVPLTGPWEVEVDTMSGARVWRSREAAARTRSLVVAAETGVFAPGVTRLQAGADFQLRVRQQEGGVWSAWSAPHAPFRVQKEIPR